MLIGVGKGTYSIAGLTYGLLMTCAASSSLLPFIPILAVKKRLWERSHGTLSNMPASRAGESVKGFGDPNDVLERRASNTDCCRLRFQMIRCFAEPK